jgi:hypothetical protein
MIQTKPIEHIESQKLDAILNRIMKDLNPKYDNNLIINKGPLCIVKIK